MGNLQRKTATVVVSGAFDPLHEGHLELFARAKKLGHVVCVLKGDNRLTRKKGSSLLKAETRKKLVKPFVDDVIIYDNKDKANGDISGIINQIGPEFYVTADILPENKKACDQQGTMVVMMKKINSSSKLLKHYFSDHEYRFIIDRMPILCVDGLIVSNGKYLLVKRKNNPLKGRWWIPGGRVVKGEKLTDAFKRKMKEEVGLDVEVVGVAGYYEDSFKDNEFGVDSVHTTSIVFIASPTNTKVKLDSQSADYKWTDKLPKDLIIL